MVSPGNLFITNPNYHMWVILRKMSTIFMTWKPKVNASRIIAENIPNNNKIHIYVKVSVMHASELRFFFVHFLILIHRSIHVIILTHASKSIKVLLIKVKQKLIMFKRGKNAENKLLQ